MRTRWLIVGLAACSFEHGTVTTPTADGGPIDAMSADAIADGSRDAPIDAPRCPSTYAASGASMYRFVSSGASWTGAEADCENDGFGTHLVVAPNNTEILTVDALSSASHTWLGESDRVTSGAWKWVTGATATSLGGTQNSHCGEYYDGSGNPGAKGAQAADCTSSLPYVCECDLVPADPNSY